MHNLTNVKTSRDERAWEIEIKADIPAEILAKYRDEALKDIQKSAKLDGFRPGKAPIDRILQAYGEPTVMRHAAEIAIEHELPSLIAAEKFMIVESPRVTTDAPESGKSLSFTARASLAPSITLPDYKKISKKHSETKEDTSVEDTEHLQALTHLRRERARIDKIESGTDAEKAAEESRAMEEKDLPELDDEFVQQLGYPSAEAFTSAVRANIQTEKEMKAKEKRRAAILDELIAGAKISYPASLRGYELEEMEARFKDDLARAGTTFEKYLEDSKKTREEILKSWEEAADKRAKIRLILSDIARQESISPTPEVLAHELEHAKEHYKNADPQALYSHILHAMRNEMTLRFLEGDAEPVGHSSHDHGERATEA